MLTFWVWFVIFLLPSGVFGQGLGSADVNVLDSTNSSSLSGCALSPPDGRLVLGGSFSGDLSVGGNMLSSHGLTDALVLKTDGQGGIAWAGHGGGVAADQGTKVAVDSQGNVYLAGYFLEVASFGEENDPVILNSMLDVSINSAFVVKYAANGTIQLGEIFEPWELKTGEISVTSQAKDLCVDSSNDLYLVGSFWGNNFCGFPRILSDGLDGFVLKMSSKLVIDWVMEISDKTPTQATSVAMGGTDRVYVAGLKEESLFVQAFDASNGDADPGFTEVEQALGTSLAEKVYAPDLAVGENGYVYVTGAVNGTQDFNGTELISQNNTNDIFVAAYTDEGDQVFATSLGSSGQDIGHSVSVTAEGDVLVVGEIGGVVEISGQQFGSAGETRTLVVLLDGATGEIKDATSFSGTLNKAFGSVVDGAVSYVAGEFDDSGMNQGFWAQLASTGNIVPMISLLLFN